MAEPLPTSPTPTAKKKKRGAQPGNLNALSHGFYARAFQPDEVTDLDTLLATGLNDEITMLRVVTRRVLALAQESDDLDKTMNALGALGMASTRLAGLLKTQRLLGNASNDTTAAIAAAIGAVMQEFACA